MGIPKQDIIFQLKHVVLCKDQPHLVLIIVIVGFTWMIAFNASALFISKMTYTETRINNMNCMIDSGIKGIPVPKSLEMIFS